MAYKMKGFGGFGYLIEQAAAMGGKTAKKLAEGLRGGMLEDTTKKMFDDAGQRKTQSANQQRPTTIKTNKKQKEEKEEKIIVGPPKASKVDELENEHNNSAKKSEGSKLKQSARRIIGKIKNKTKLKK